jgi:hypothetical protein
LWALDSRRRWTRHSRSLGLGRDFFFGQGDVSLLSRLVLVGLFLAFLAGEELREKTHAPALACF